MENDWERQLQDLVLWLSVMSMERIKAVSLICLISSGIVLNFRYITKFRKFLIDRWGSLEYYAFIKLSL